MYASYAYNTTPSNDTSQTGDTMKPLQMDVSSATKLIENFDRIQLNDLQEDEGKFNEFIQGLQQVKDIQPQRDTLLAGNQSLADYNLKLKPKFCQLKGELASKYEELKSSRERLMQIESQFDGRMSEQQSPEVMLALLQTETALTEEKSEQIANEFLEKSMELDKFIDEYISSQTLFYARQFKVGKMKELLQSRPAMTQPPPTSSTPQWYQNTPPYPTNYYSPH